VALPKGRIDV
jgi:hypothetical protein